jgi:hypothetical protein
VVYGSASCDAPSAACTSVARVTRVSATSVVTMAMAIGLKVTPERMSLEAVRF